MNTYEIVYRPPIVGLSGFEPLTSRLSGVRSNQLSYKPVIILQPSLLKHKITEVNDKENL